MEEPKTEENQSKETEEIKVAEVVAEPEPVRRSNPGDLHIICPKYDTAIYHGDDVVQVQAKQKEEEEEVDDSFFEVTANDVKSMYKDLQTTRDKLENAPLIGQKLRALEKETAILKSLHDHPNTVVRIRFPDRFILQGIFRTSDTISSVKAWVKEFLSNQELDFYLFTAPPRTVLENDVKLVEGGLVAMVVIYFGSQSPLENNKILKEEIYSRISAPEQVFELAKTKLKVRVRESAEDDQEVKESEETKPKDHSKDATPQPTVRRPADKGKVPKWFKMK